MTDQKTGIFYGYVIVGVSVVIVILLLGVFLSFGLFLSHIEETFGWTRAMTSGAFALSWLVQGVFSIFIGRLNDRFGPRLTLTVTGLLMGAGYILISRLTNLWELYLYYGVILGAGTTGGFVPLTSTIARWFVKRRSLMTGIVLSGGSLGMFIAPITASWLIRVYNGWRTPYFILGIVVLVAIVALAQLLRRDPAQKGLQPYGAGPADMPALTSGARSVTTRKALRMRRYWIVGAVFFMIGYFVTSTNLHIVPLAADLKIPESDAARVLSIIGLSGVLGGVGLGRLGDRVGNRNAFIVGFIIMTAVLAWLTTAGSLWQLYIFAPVFGFALQGCLTLQAPLTAELFGLESMGVILGSLSLAYNFGSAAGSFLSGLLRDVTGHYLVSVGISAALAAAALVLMIMLRPVVKVPAGDSRQTDGASK